MERRSQLHFQSLDVMLHALAVLSGTHSPTVASHAQSLCPIRPACRPAFDALNSEDTAAKQRNRPKTPPWLHDTILCMGQVRRLMGIPTTAVSREVLGVGCWTTQRRVEGNHYIEHPSKRMKRLWPLWVHSQGHGLGIEDITRTHKETPGVFRVRGEKDLQDLEMLPISSSLPTRRDCRQFLRLAASHG
jgi:hypothetical protein